MGGILGELVAGAVGIRVGMCRLFYRAADKKELRGLKLVAILMYYGLLAFEFAFVFSRRASYELGGALGIFAPMESRSSRCCLSHTA